MSLRPEQQRALGYARKRGSESPVGAIRERVAGTYAALDALIETIPATVARERRATSAWSIQEVVDHLLESDRPAVEQLARLLAGDSVEEPIPASLQSVSPLDRDWNDLRTQLRAVHHDLLALLAAASDDDPTSATAAVQMVVKCAAADGTLEPVSWLERFDWKAFAILLHAHNREHIAQIQRILAATDAPAAAAAVAKKGRSMPTLATGTFEVELAPQSEDKGEGVTLSRYSLDKQFHGDLEGSGKGEMLAAGAEATGAGVYVAVERVTGTLQGRTGSFALVHRGVRSSAGQQLEITVVPESGSGQLAGLAGTLAIRIADGKHFYDLEYTLPASL